MFDKKGQIIIDKEECELSSDDLMMKVLDFGAEDFSEEDDSFEVITDPDSFDSVREAIEKDGIKMVSADVVMLPQNYVDINNEEDQKALERLLDMLDEDDDVQAVYHNWNE